MELIDVSVIKDLLFRTVFVVRNAKRPFERYAARPRCDLRSAALERRENPPRRKVDIEIIYLNKNPPPVYYNLYIKFNIGGGKFVHLFRAREIIPFSSVAVNKVRFMPGDVTGGFEGRRPPLAGGAGEGPKNSFVCYCRVLLSVGEQRNVCAADCTACIHCPRFWLVLPGPFLWPRRSSLVFPPSPAVAPRLPPPPT